MQSDFTLYGINYSTLGRKVFNVEVFRCKKIMEVKMYYLSREFTFDAAHRIVNYQGKCEKLHGHTYRLKVTVAGKLGDNGMVIDFAIIKKVVNEMIIDKLDHCYLNDLFENPTTEIVTHWIYTTLLPAFKKYDCTVCEISLSEGANNTVTFRGDDNERHTE